MTIEFNPHKKMKKKLYAYRHKKIKESVGLLEALDYKDAAKHLGSSFQIKKIEIEQDLWWEFVCSETAGRVKFVNNLWHKP